MADQIQWLDADGLPIRLIIGTDFSPAFTIYTTAGHTVAQNISGWALSFLVKRSMTDADASALIEKTTASGIAISGTFNADPGVNTQKAVVTIEDEDTDAIAPGFYYCELKRTDAGLETVLAYGPFPLERGVHRA